jgi:isorenieratene synthase
LTTTSSSPDALIIGGGLAGLSAALHLAERGLKPLVLEADLNYCGGRLAGGDMIEFQQGGQTWRFRLEHGVHGFWSPYRNLQAMLARHNLRPVFVPAREEAWIYKRANGRVTRVNAGSHIRHSLFPAPLHYLALFFSPRFLAALDIRDGLTLLEVWYGLVLALGVDPLKEDQPLEDQWLSDLVASWGPGVRSFMMGLTRNGLAGTPAEIPLSGYVAFMRFYTLLRRDAWEFSYLPGDGGTALIDPLAKRIEELGGSIRLGAQVDRLERSNDHWIAHSPIGSFTARSIILAAAAQPIRSILCASEATRDIAETLHFPRSMPTAIVRFWYDAQPKSKVEAGIITGDVIVDNYFWLHRLQDQYARWSKATGGSAIEVHIYGPPEVLEKPDELLLSRAANDVQSAFPELRGHLIHQHLQHNAPLHTLFGLGRAEQHLTTVTPWPELYCCGDWVRRPEPAFFMERACVTGIAAANEVLKSHDLQPWATLDYPKPEAFAGWLEKLMHRGRRILRKRKTNYQPPTTNNQLP